MTNYLLNLDGRILRILRFIGKEADRREMSAYVVGGFVRDLILKKKNLDLDITIDGDAIALSKILAKKWKAHVTVYQQFGTSFLELPNGIRVDVAKTRNELYKHSGALPTVKAGSLKEDLFRRDFTINALAIGINSDTWGHLIDLFGGHKDLLDKKIRVLHGQSFIDDPTRILRAVRFEQRLKFQIERRTLTMIKLALKRGVEEKVKPPRYFAEFKKIFKESSPMAMIKRLIALGGLRFINSKLSVSLRDLKVIHEKIQELKGTLLYKKYSSWWVVYFIELIAKTNDNVVEKIIGKFHFTRNEIICIQQSRNIGDILKKISGKSLKASHIYKILKPLKEGVILYLYLKSDNALVHRRINRFLLEDVNAKLRINGNDLRKMGIAPGPRTGEILDRILRLKIDKQIQTKREECNEALRIIGK